MIVVHGIGNDNSDEYRAATEMAAAARQEIPEIDSSREIFLELFPGVQCFGQKTQDIDLLVFFADYRHPSQLYRSKEGKVVHSFCTTVEVKSHFFDSVHFVGPECYVKYNGQDHNVTAQSEGQKYSVKNYIERNSKSKRSPWVINVIWMKNVPCGHLPKIESNLIGSNPTWTEFIEKVAFLSKRDRVETFSSRSWMTSITSVFSKRIQPSKIERKRIEAITKNVLDREKQKYAKKLGQQFLIFRGRGGTGKTVRLIQIATQAYDEFGSRVILLTYNKALVADIRRQLAIRGVKNSVGERGMAVRTIYSFMRQWLVSLGIISNKCDDFLKKYEDYKQEAIQFIREGIISQDDISKARIKHSRDLSWDLLLVDESQDWPQSERDLLYLLYSYKNFIIADGVDQFVRGVERTNWRDNITTSDSQVITLKKSLRLKAALCQTVNGVAEEIELPEWSLEPLPESYGGKVYVVTGNGLSEKLHNKIFATSQDKGNKPIDMLFCVPPAWVNKDARGHRQSVVAKEYHKLDKEVWDAVDPDLRDEYPTSFEQFRIVQYESCRGLEGWVVVCFALDEFFEFKKTNANISDDERAEMFFEEEAAKLEYAKRWLMIPLTRAIDTLIIHIQEPSSYIGQVLKTLHHKHPDKIEWLSYE